MNEHLSEASKTLSITLSNLDVASTQSDKILAKFKNYVEKYLSQTPTITDVHDVDLIILGSLARQELTVDSDCDFFVLQNGCPPDLTQELIAIADRVREELDLGQPGREGVFGEIVIGGSLYERIGLESDTNQNLTHRILLLTESFPVFSTPAYDAVLENILKRYSADYLPPRREEGCAAKIPRHLLNDLVRFWRTMAVDFGAKRWRRSSSNNQPVRLLKLRTTRKVLFAGPLCSLLLIPDRIQQATELQEYLRVWLSKPPIAQLASIVTDPTVGEKLAGPTKAAVKNLLLNYDALIGVFNERGARDDLNKSDRAGHQDRKQECERLANGIEDALETIFFDDPVFKPRVRQYTLF